MKQGKELCKNAWVWWEKQEENLGKHCCGKLRGLLINSFGGVKNLQGSWTLNVVKCLEWFVKLW